MHHGGLLTMDSYSDYYLMSRPEFQFWRWKYHVQTQAAYHITEGHSWSWQTIEVTNL